eukprot:17242-Heterococcus_DN1.PRE.6
MLLSTMHTPCRFHTVRNGVDIANNSFEVKPELGLLQPGELQLISLKFTPQYSVSSTRSGVMTIHSANNTHKLQEMYAQPLLSRLIKRNT